MVKTARQRLLAMFMAFAMVVSVMPLLTLPAKAYTAPAPLSVIWPGADQSATCHDFEDYITSVSFAGVTNVSGTTPGWHTDYGRSVPQVNVMEVQQGQTYNIEVAVTGLDHSFHYLAVYIDWNGDGNNGELSIDSGEEAAVWSGYTGSGPKTHTASITVPSDAATGYVYMRVMLDADGGSGDYTCAVGYGEFEDYVLNVSPAGPTIIGAAYNAGTGILDVSGSGMSLGHTIVPSKLTLTGEGGATYTLTSLNVTASSSSNFSVHLNAVDRAAVNQILNKNGTSSTGGIVYNLAAADDWNLNATASLNIEDLTGNLIMVSNVAAPAITSAAYNASTGALVVNGTGFLTRSGAANDIVANKFRLTGEGGNTYTLTDTQNVDITSGTSFIIALSETDKAAVNLILNKNGTTSTNVTTYNLAAAEDWAAGADAAVAVADLVGNGITVGNVAVPTITSAIYNPIAGVITVTGMGFLTRSGAANDIVVNKLTLTGEGGNTYTLTTAGVDISSGTSFTFMLSGADRAAVNQILNKDGMSSTGGTLYNLAAAEDWAAGADPAITVADTTGNAVMVINVAVPTITSAAYDASTGALVVSGTDFLIRSGAANDIVANKLTLIGEGGAAYTLTDTQNVDITSGTSFTITLSAADKAAVNLILNKNGTSSLGGTAYNLAAGEDWAAGADSAVIVADTTGNAVTVSKVAPKVTISSTVPNPTNSSPFSIVIAFTEIVSDFEISDITVTNGSVSNFSGIGATYTADITPAGQGLVAVNIAAGAAHDSAGIGNTAAAELSRIYDSAAPDAPIVLTLSQTVNAGNIAIIGTAEAGAAITITGGAGPASGTADGSGDYFIIVSLTQDAVNTLVVKATDAAGNNSATTSVAITEDSTAPAAPIILTPAQTINADSITVTGTAEAGAMVIITGGASLAAGMADGSGNYSISVNLTQNAVNTLVVRAIDAADNNSGTSSVAITEDSTAPAAPIILTPAQTINADSITVTGTAEAGAMVIITGGSALAAGTADGSGSYSISVNLTQDAVNTLVVKATDAAGNNSATSSVAITEDSTAPAVTTSDAVTISVTAAIDGATVCALTATDATSIPGFTDSLLWSVSGGADADKFLIDGADLKINNASGLATGSYTIQVTARDTAGNTNAKTITVTVAAGPTVSAVEIVYNDTEGYDIPRKSFGTIIATPNSGTITGYGIAGGTTASAGAEYVCDAVSYNVSKTGTYGTLYVKSEDGKYVYVVFSNAIFNAQTTTVTDLFTIEASDDAGTSGNSLTVTINGANDTPVMMLSNSVVRENVAEDTVVGTLTSVDYDAGHTTFIYALVAGDGDTDNALFSIVDDRLYISFSPDYETKSSYFIRIRTTDPGGLYNERAFTITISNLNETPTDIILSSTSVNENVIANATVGTLSTTDPDIGNTHTYYLIDGDGDTDNAAFNIDGSSLRISSSPNFEAKNSYSVRIRTRDQGAMWYEEVFTITIIDINETPTDIALSNNAINENAIANATVGTLSTTDPDAGNTHTYSLVAGAGSADNALFSFSGGSLRISTSPNYETKSSYSVRVRTTDQGGLYYEKAFTINITDLNETPTDITLSSASVNENVAGNTAVGTLSTADPDTGNTHTYSLVAGAGSADNSSFNIDGGSLRIRVSPDYETKSSYSVRVRTTDQGGLFYEKALMITINNINETPTDMTLSNNATNENVAAGATVGTLSTTDPDAGGTFIYTLVNGDGAADNASFNIDGGSLRIQVSPDYETKNSYSVRVRTTDQGGLYYEEVFTITITDINETPTDIALSNNAVNENVAENTAVGTLSTTDPDAGGTFTYSLVAGDGGTDNASFNIDGGSLCISVSPDYETKNSYSVRVRTTDQGGLYYEKVFMITIININETPADIALSNNSVNENVAENTAVGTLSTTDPDAGNTHTYSLVAGDGGADNALFNIDGGSLRIQVSPDYETKSSYSVRVRTTDQGGLSYEKSFTIIINNVNEGPGDIGLSASSVNENVAENTSVGTLSTTDPDAGGTFTYLLVAGDGGTDNASFNISGGSLRISVSPDYETKRSYSVRVRTTDQGGLSYEKIFTITINNVNEAPVISTADSLSTAEGFAEAFTAKGTDPEGSAITWSITGGADGAKFSIAAGTGIVSFVDSPSFLLPIDADTDNTYILEIAASDGALTATKIIAVTVTKAPDTTAAVIEVNGESQDAGQAFTETVGGTTTTTITVDDAKLNAILDQKGSNAKVTLSVNTESDVLVGELNGQTVKNMQNKNATLEIKTETVTYTLPASQINIDAVSSQFGSQVELKDIKVSVRIAEPSVDTVKIVEDTANRGNYQLIVTAVEFEITCTSGDKVIEVSRFNGYVERLIAIPDGVDPAKITTGIVLSADGTFRHVPTQIVVIDGRYYAKINSLTNSTYSVIYNPVMFTDVAGHWAKDAINDMGSRMVVMGIGKGIYEPERSITRAEFTAIIVRALGLAPGAAESAFDDVALADWFNGYVDTATSYGLITGYGSARFGPNDTITREQAMTILARAMKLTGLSVSLTDGEVSSLLANYSDAGLISDYAKAGAAACIKTGVVLGTTATTISPKDYVTRAEVAVMIQRLLQKSGLI